MERLLSVEGVLQVNNSSLESRSSRKFVIDLISKGFPVIFGSDSHGMDVRSPNFEGVVPALQKHLSAKEFEEQMRRQKNLLEEF
jgi:tyrosine-protein phosphatase YwqE